MGVKIYAGGVELPSPTEISSSEEIIWSANTGRSTTGLMLGDVVAEKKALNLRWGILNAEEYERIRSNLRSGFNPFVIELDGAATTLTAYRGTLSASLLGGCGEGVYYRDASVSVIEQ